MNEHPSGILDTSAVIALPSLTDPDLLPQAPFITAITLAELSVGPLVATTAEEQARRQLTLQQAESDFNPIPFDDAAARAFGQIAASLRRSGQTSRARAYDALIAAIAVSRDLPLYTANPRHFTNIVDLTVVEVPAEGQP